MKNKQLLCVLFPLLVACTGQRHQQQVSSESIIEEAVRKGEVLKGEIVPIDTALFRYAYRLLGVYCRLHVEYFTICSSALTSIPNSRPAASST